MAITLSPIRPGFGAEVAGIDISRPLSDTDASAIVQAMDDYSVLVFRDSHLDDEAHVRFSEIFGYVERYPSSIQKVLKGENASQEEAPAEYGSFINGITNMTADGRISDDPERRILFAADRYWHTDSSFIKQRAGYSALLAHVVPPEGGLTWFADLRAAYDDLPAAMKTRIEGLEAEHCMWWSRILGGYAMTEEMAMRMPAAVHPIVHTLRSGRTSLYLASHARAVVGMDPHEGRALLAELTAFATQDKYIFSVKWQPGDLVVWSNLATLHRGGGFDEMKHKRNMRRTTIRAGTAPDHDDQPHLDMYRKSLEIMGRSTEVVS